MHVSSVDARHFGKKMKQGTGKEEGDPLGIPKLLGDPIYGEEEKTYKHCFKENVHYSMAILYELAFRREMRTPFASFLPNGRPRFVRSS